MCEGHCGSLCMCERVFKFSDSCSLVHYNPTLLIPSKQQTPAERDAGDDGTDSTGRTRHIS